MLLDTIVFDLFWASCLAHWSQISCFFWPHNSIHEERLTYCWDWPLIVLLTLWFNTQGNRVFRLWPFWLAWFIIGKFPLQWKSSFPLKDTCTSMCMRILFGLSGGITWRLFSAILPFWCVWVTLYLQTVCLEVTISLFADNSPVVVHLSGILCI